MRVQVTLGNKQVKTVHYPDGAITDEKAITAFMMQKPSLAEAGIVSVSVIDEAKALKNTEDNLKASRAEAEEIALKAKAFSESPEGVGLAQSRLYGQVVTELSTGSAALKTARAGVSYSAMRKAALSVCEAAKFQGTVKELTEKALAELKIE